MHGWPADRLKEENIEEKAMRRKVIKTTLGDLIVAVTEKLKPLVRDPLRRNMMVSWVLSDLLTHQQARKRSRHRHSARFARALY
jgi:hypothetical protein